MSPRLLVPTNNSMRESPSPCPNPMGGQAAWHARRGWVFVACDHLCVGDSSMPTQIDDISFEVMAAVNAAVVESVTSLLASGEVDPDFPPIDGLVRIGLGQSMGGCLLIVQQGLHATFGVLGCSAIHTVLAWRPLALVPKWSPAPSCRLLRPPPQTSRFPPGVFTWTTNPKMWCSIRRQSPRRTTARGMSRCWCGPIWPICTTVLPPGSACGPNEKSRTAAHGGPAARSVGRPVWCRQDLAERRPPRDVRDVVRLRRLRR